MLAIVLLLLTIAPAMAQTGSVYAGQTTSLEVVPIQGDTYMWELYDNVTGINFVTVPGNCPVTSADFVGGNTGAKVNVKWLKPGIYFYKVTAWREYGASFCSTNNLKVGKITILKAIPTALFTDHSPICKGDTAYLSVTLTGIGPWSITYTDGTTPVTITGITGTPFFIPVSPKFTTQYSIISVTDANGTNNKPTTPVTLVVNPKPSMSRIIQF